MSQQQDSALSITASVAGILTFVYAVIAGTFGYFYILKSFSQSDTDIQRFYDAFTACALESDLVRKDILASRSFAPLSPTNGFDPRSPLAMQDNYLLDPDSLVKLYEQVRAVEIAIQIEAAKIIKTRPTSDGSFLSKLMGKGKWVNRSRDLQDSLAKREALTARLLVIQMSLFSARIHSQSEIVDTLKSQVEVSEREIVKLKEQLSDYIAAGGRHPENVKTRQ